MSFDGTATLPAYPQNSKTPIWRSLSPARDVFTIEPPGSVIIPLFYALLHADPYLPDEQELLRGWFQYTYRYPSYLNLYSAQLRQHGPAHLWSCPSSCSLRTGQFYLFRYSHTGFNPDIQSLPYLIPDIAVPCFFAIKKSNAEAVRIALCRFSGPVFDSASGSGPLLRLRPRISLKAQPSWGSTLFCCLARSISPFTMLSMSCCCSTV